MVFEGPLQWCRLSAAAWRLHMSAQNPVGVIPASKSVRRAIEVAVLRGTSENCTLDCMRRANLPTATLSRDSEVANHFPTLLSDGQTGRNPKVRVADDSFRMQN
jgi:alkylhydroperoxidase family enzyme